MKDDLQKKAKVEEIDETKDDKDKESEEKKEESEEGIVMLSVFAWLLYKLRSFIASYGSLVYTFFSLLSIPILMWDLRSWCSLHVFLFELY